jgi:ribonuclease VapC
MTIAVDTSAIIAVLLGEDDAESMIGALASNAGDMGISAATLVETRIVAEAKQGTAAAADLRTLLTAIDADIIAVDADQADIAAAAWMRFGRGRHPAALDFGDCFSYALAKSLGAPLLFKGNDFTQTDIASAL